MTETKSLPRTGTTDEEPGVVQPARKGHFGVGLLSFGDVYRDPNSTVISKPPREDAGGMRGTQAIPVAFWVLGVALLADAVLRGAARVTLVVIVPVLSGQSAEFLIGVVLLFAGFLTLPWLFLGEEQLIGPSPGTEDGPAPPPLHSSGEVGGGGLILIGPVPILFGGWRTVSRRTRWALAVVGAAVLAVFVAVILFAVL